MSRTRRLERSCVIEEQKMSTVSIDFTIVFGGAMSNWYRIRLKHRTPCIFVFGEWEFM